MKLLYSALAAILLEDTLVTSQPGNLNSCGKQAPCLDFTISKNNVCGGGGCSYTVCMKTNFAHESCSKGVSGTISGTCVRPGETQCTAGDCIFGAGVATEVTGIGNEFEQCQTVPAGSKAYFIVKDSNMCDSTDSVPRDVYDLDTEANWMYQAQCAPTEAYTPPHPVEGCLNSQDVDTCTGHHPGKQCVWTVQTDDTGCSPPTCTPIEQNCCPIPQFPCEAGDCDGVVVCPEPPAPHWSCKLVCEQETDVDICPEAVSPERRNLKEAADFAHDSFLRGL